MNPYQSEVALQAAGVPTSYSPWLSPWSCLETTLCNPQTPSMFCRIDLFPDHVNIAVISLSFSTFSCRFFIWYALSPSCFLFRSLLFSFFLLASFSNFLIILFLLFRHFASAFRSVPNFPATADAFRTLEHWLDT